MILSLLASRIGRLVAIGIVVAALTMALYFQVRAGGRLRAERDRVLQTNDENQRLLDAQTRETKRANEIATQEAKNAQAWRAHYNLARMGIANARPSDDGPVAPVLRDALSRLPEPNSHQIRSDPTTDAPSKSYAVPEQP